MPCLLLPLTKLENFQLMRYERKTAQAYLEVDTWIHNKQLATIGSQPLYRAKCFVCKH